MNEIIFLEGDIITTRDGIVSRYDSKKNEIVDESWEFLRGENYSTSYANSYSINSFKCSNKFDIIEHRRADGTLVWKGDPRKDGDMKKEKEMEEVGVVTATPATLETVFETGDEITIKGSSYFYIEKFNRAYSKGGFFFELDDFNGYKNTISTQLFDITLHKRGDTVLYDASKREPRIPDENTPRGTRVLYKDFEEDSWNKGYFKGFEKHANLYPFKVFVNGKDEWSSDGKGMGWKYCQIAEEE